MQIVKFKKAHLDQMVIQERQQGLEYLHTDEMFESIASDDAFTAIDDDGTIFAVAGVVRMTPNRGVAWSYLSNGLGVKMSVITRAVLRYLKIAPFERIEMHVDCDFAQAHRWAKMLGFEMECERMRCFTPDRRDCALYAMIKV